MRNIGLVIQRELGSYLRTQSGYLIAAAVLLVDALAFNAFAVGNEPKFSTEVLEIFFYYAGAFTMIGAVAFSMRLLAEERATGTYVLLMTSPVREFEIVLGKFLSAFIVLSLVTLLSLYLPALIFVHGKVSPGHIAAGYVGLLLLGGAILAVGTFASTLVTNPFFAVVVAGVFAGLMELCWEVAKISDEPLSQVLSYISPHAGHLTYFRRGVIRVSDIVYYLSVIYIALLAATTTLKSQRWR